MSLIGGNYLGSGVDEASYRSGPPAELPLDLSAAFAQVWGRYPNAGDDYPSLRQAWNSLSASEFQQWIRPDPLGYGPVRDLNYSGGVNLPAIPGGMMLPPGGVGKLPGVIGQVGGVISGVSGIIDLFKPKGVSGGSSTTGPAPKATFFGGECPPGRVVRRLKMGRDICIKKPRMNPFNPRALAKADRRVTSFARRSKAILQDMGFKVSSRKVSLAKKKRKR